MTKLQKTLKKLMVKKFFVEKRRRHKGMKTIKSCSKFLAVLLTVLIIVSILPMQTFATEYKDYKTLTTIDSESDEDLIIQNEVIEERTSNSKTYLLEDGTYCSLTTSEPIHTYSDGEWVDIDVVSESPKTIDEAICQLSGTPSAFSNTNVDDGLIVNGSDQPIYIYGLNYKNEHTDGIVNLSQTSIGLLRVNVDTKPLYNKTEVTVKADLRLSCNSLTDKKDISIKPMNKDWDINTLNYAKLVKESAQFPTLDYNSIDNSGRYVWDITSEYIKWESGTHPNYGLILSVDKRTTTVYSGVLSRQYRVIDDNDTGFTYHDIDMGRAGTVYINDYTNVPYLVRDEISLSGNIMPVSISRFINPSVENVSFGSGGCWNYQSKLSKTADTYIWDMFNGSSVRFQRAVPIETDSDNREKWVEYEYNAQGYTLWIDTNKSRDWDYSNNRIVDNSENIYTFTYYGYVSSIINGMNNNDKLTITYNGETINSITDGVGRKINFVYDTIDQYSVVSKIAAYNKSGSQIITTKPLEISFEYKIINNKIYLTKSIYNDNKIVEYIYDEIGRLIQIKNIDESILELTYAVKANDVGENISPIYAYRISQFTKKYPDEDGKYFIDFSVKIDSTHPYHREFTQINDSNIYNEKLQFNRSLDLLYMKDGLGNSFYADYDKSHNLISLVIPEPEEPNNIIINGDMEIPSTGTYPAMWESESDASNFETNYINPNTYEDAYVTFHNSTDKTLILSQNIIGLNGKKGDKYILSSWGLGESTVPHENHFWGLRVIAKNPNGEMVQIHQMAFDSSMWLEEQLRYTAFSLLFDTNEVNVQLVSDEQKGYVSFNDVCLYKAENAYVAAVDDVESETVCKCKDCEYPFCTCECETEENCNCISCNIKTTDTNDSHGNPLETVTTNGLTNLKSKNEYTTNGNYLSKYIDENNVATSYEYSLTNGLLQSKKLADNNAISYGYDAIGTLTSVSQDVTNVLTGNTVTMNTEYGYENDRIKSVTHNGFSYNYNYDIYGNVESITVGETELVSYKYNQDYYNNISEIKYANGDKIIYQYDNKDNITGIKFGGDNDWRYTYTYDEFNQLKSFTDNVSKRLTSYNKTIDGVKYTEVVETLGDNSQVIYGVTEEQNGEYVQSVFGKNYSISTKTNYDSATGNAVIEKFADTVVCGEDGTIENVCTKDAFERIVSDYMSMNTDSNNIHELQNVKLCLKNEYTYKNPSDTQTSRLVDTYTSSIYYESTVNGNKAILNELKLKYDYDSSGRISMISIPNPDDETSGYCPVNIYEYDEAGQLTVEANMYLGTVCAYTYDAGGNITSKSYFDNADYDESSKKIILGEPTDTITYEYDSVWKDKLVSYNGTAIEYDALGNPLKYNASVFGDSDENMNLEWTGRLLTAATKDDNTMRFEYSYDADGLRTEKIIYTGETVSEESVDENGNTIATERHIFVPLLKFEYIWSGNVPAGYRICIYEEVKDENGNVVLDDNGNAVMQTSDSQSIVMNIIYNENGEALGVNCQAKTDGEETSTTFLFIKDAQGNVASISALEGGYFFNFCYCFSIFWN